MLSIHPQARTTPAIRSEIARSPEPTGVLAQRFSVSTETIRKWRKRGAEDCQDHSSRPHKLPWKATEEERAIVCALRRSTGFPLDDITFIVTHFLPHLNRDAVYRILKAEGLGRLPPAQQRKRQSGTFKDYDLGFVHLDIKHLPKLRTANGESRKRFLYVAIDRCSRWVHLAVKDDELTTSAVAFLKEAIRAFPFKVTHVLTDRGSCFTADGFEEACRQLKVEHRKTKPYTPQTNGLVERFNGRVQREVLGITIYSHRDLETLLKGFNQAYNRRRQRVLKGASPEQVVQRRLEAEPKLANQRFKPPDPHALPQALQVVAHAKEVSHPDRRADVRRQPGLTRVLGFTESELLTRPYADFMHPDDVGATVAGLACMGETGKPTRFENRILTASGEWKPIEWTVAPEPDGVNFIAIGRDITAEKEAAVELERAQEALRQAQKMEAVGQLTGGIAHDFNNLLAGIVGSLDLMQTRIAQGRMENIERYAKAAMNSAQRAAALTHRLLAFSRRQPLDPKPVNANQLVASMEDLLRRTIGPLHALEIVTADGLWTTLCDPNQLESAILNLAINARDAMPDGGKLVIETANAHLDNAYAASQRDVVPGQYVAICITDTGMGMPPDVIERAFEPFFTTKPLGQGTGLGLSMVYGFAKQSEGHLRIYSQVGQGTTIKIYLPRHRGAALEDQPADLALEAPRAEAGETVLVVEDEPVIRDLIVEVLRELGYRALEAADGTAGLKVLQSRKRIDLLVTDVGLPGVNGRQLADQARVTRPDLKVLFITGYAENATLPNGFLDPGMEMITKPFAIEALATRIRNMIQGS